MNVAKFIRLRDGAVSKHMAITLHERLPLPTADAMRLVEEAFAAAATDADYVLTDDARERLESLELWP